MKNATNPKRPSPFLSRDLAVTLIAAFVFLLVAIGLIVWIFVQRHSSVADDISANTQADDGTQNTTNAAWHAAAALPANYVLNDQSTVDTSQKYYFDDATNCGITTTVVNKGVGKTVEDVIMEAVSATEAQGVLTLSSNEGQEIELADYDNPETKYTFSSVELMQQVDVPGVAFSERSSIILFKQFGIKVASLSYSCRADTWDGTRDELLGLASQFTIKIE